MDLDPDRDVTSWLPPLPEDTCTSAAALRARAAAEEATRVHFSRIHDLIGSFASLNVSSLSSAASSITEGERAERKSNRRGSDVAKTGNDGVVFGMEDLGRSWGAVDCAAHHVVKALGKIRCAVASLEATLESRIQLQEEIYRLQRNFLSDREDQKFHRQQAGSSINDFNNSSNHTYNSQLPPALPVLSPYEIYLAVRDPKSLDEHVAAITKATAVQRRQADLLEGGQLYMAWAHSVLLLEKQYMEKQGKSIGKGVVSSDHGRGSKGGVGMPNIASDLSTRGIGGDLANPSTAVRTASLSHAKGKKTKADRPRWDGDAFGSHPDGFDGGGGGIGKVDADDEMNVRRNIGETTTTTTTTTTTPPPPPPAAWDPEFGGDEIGSKIRRGELQKLLPYMEAAKAAKAVKSAKAIKGTKPTKAAETIKSSHTGSSKSNSRGLNENNEQNGQSLALLPVLSHLHSRLSAESQKWLDPEFKQALLATTRVIPKGIQNLAGSLLQIPDPKDVRANQLRRHLDDQLDRLVDILHPYLAAAAAAEKGKGGGGGRRGERRRGREEEGKKGKGKEKKRYDRGNRENREGRDESCIGVSSTETEMNWDDVEILAAQTLGISDPDFGSSRIEVEEEALRDGGDDDAESASTLRQIHPKELKGDGDRKGGKYHQTTESCLRGERRAKCIAHSLSPLRHPLIASYLQLLSSSCLPSSSLSSPSSSISPLTYDCFPEDVSEILFAFTELKRQRLTVLERNRLVALLSKQASLVSYKFSDPPIAPSYNNNQISHNNNNNNISNGTTNMDNAHGGAVPGKYTKATEEAAAVAVAALEVARALAKIRASNRKALISAVQDGVLPPSVVVEGLGE
eukprot:CAMPEP_0175070144 /NCGR_PEP_ID=MMETSP0052_2-20121109/18560_1 /TAXON_ID=51329 ORGANISM="Polytomella parva, Strain SAG 63-3" /NCGR_SAMPLE_ID=MMETSP0052_2 /ASSEMBLY_ACC=CAM_ASM_000194 /LENGTH=853 /DNA_ID=CAMNT_0016337243 /DNA_START=738 /DNA_END=3300 /DNA_ORIENTATION=-